MNPATDVGKHDLPPGIRNRFTELYVSDLTDDEDLKIVVREYLNRMTAISTGFDMTSKLVEFYQVGVTSCIMLVVSYSLLYVPRWLKLKIK